MSGRSAKNILLQKRYQLRFVLFVALLSMLLISLLGYIAMGEVRIATESGIAKAESAYHLCSKDETLSGSKAHRGNGKSSVVVVLQPPSLTPESPGVRVLARVCKLGYQSQIESLKDGQWQIQVLLWTFGGIVLGFLFLYALVFTHRVSGPIHKIHLNVKSMEGGRAVVLERWRKGDHVSEFCEDFQNAQKRLREMQEEDIRIIGALIAEFQGGKVQGKAQRFLDALQQVLKQKKESLE